MPVLDVFDENGRMWPGVETPIYLWATMLVPEGPLDDWWQLHATARQVQIDLDSGVRKIAVTPPTKRLFAVGLNLVAQDGERRQCRAEQMGDAMLTMRVADRHRPEAAGRGKAFRLQAKDMAKFDDPRLLKSPAVLDRWWSSFLAVVPLWAARRLLRRSKVYGQDATVDWELLLAIAENYRIWGEQHIRPAGRTGTVRAGEPLLPTGLAWSSPGHAVLPHDHAKRLVDNLGPGRRFDEFVSDTPVKIRN